MSISVTSKIEKILRGIPGEKQVRENWFQQLEHKQVTKDMCRNRVMSSYFV